MRMSVGQELGLQNEQKCPEFSESGIFLKYPEFGEEVEVLRAILLEEIVLIKNEEIENVAGTDDVVLVDLSGSLTSTNQEAFQIILRVTLSSYPDSAVTVRTAVVLGYEYNHQQFDELLRQVAKSQTLRVPQLYDTFCCVRDWLLQNKNSMSICHETSYQDSVYPIKKYHKSSEEYMNLKDQKLKHGGSPSYQKQKKKKNSYSRKVLEHIFNPSNFPDEHVFPILPIWTQREAALSLNNLQIQYDSEIQEANQQTVAPVKPMQKKVKSATKCGRF